MSDLYERGMKVRRAVLGDKHVDRATAGITEFNREFQELITRYAWGEIWTRPGLDRKTRSCMVLTATIALGAWEEFRLHMNAAFNNGVTEDELERAKTRLIADAVYAQDSQATLARWYGAALTTGGSVEQVKSWPDRIRATTAEQVQEAARRWLDKRRSVTGYLVKDLQPVEKRP